MNICVNKLINTSAKTMQLASIFDLPWSIIADGSQKKTVISSLNLRSRSSRSWDLPWYRRIERTERWPPLILWRETRGILHNIPAWILQPKQSIVAKCHFILQYLKQLIEPIFFIVKAFDYSCETPSHLCMCISIDGFFCISWLGKIDLVSNIGISDLIFY